MDLDPGSWGGLELGLKIGPVKTSSPGFPESHGKKDVQGPRSIMVPDLGLSEPRISNLFGTLAQVCRQHLKKMPTELKKNTDDVKLLYEKACQVSRRYRRSFWAIANIREDRRLTSPPPPGQARVKHRCFILEHEAVHWDRLLWNYPDQAIMNIENASIPYQRAGTHPRGGGEGPGPLETWKTLDFQGLFR